MTAVINEDSLFAFIIKCSLALLLVLTAAGSFFYSGRFGISILTGGVIAILNFVWMRNMLQRIIFFSQANPVRYAQFRFMVRLSIIAFALYMIITSGFFSITGIVVGLSIIIINLIGLSFYFFLRTGG